MKKLIPYSILGLMATILMSTTLLAQEKTEVTIKVTRDGKVVQDTTYQFDDEAEAKHAMKMMEILSGDDEHMMEYNYTMAHSHGDRSKAVVYISEDGKKTEIKEFHGDSLVWVSEGEYDGDHVNIIRKKLKEGDHPHGENVFIMKSGDGDTFDILIDEDEDGHKIIRKKNVEVIVSGDGDGTWHVDGKDLEHVDEDVYVISGDNVKVELKEILEEHGEGENVKVIVIKKTHEDGEHDEDIEHDHDEDGEHEVEVEVEKKVKKKSKKQ